MTTTTKIAKSYKEAAEMLKGYTFEYVTENYGENLDYSYSTVCRHFNGTNEFGANCFAMIETIEEGKLTNVRFINICRKTAIDIKIEIEEPAEKQNAKFEEGKTYFRIWNEDDGRPHTARYTVIKRTPKTIVLKSGSRCRIHTCEDGIESAKIGYSTYIYANNVFGEDTIKAQATADNWWAQEDKRVEERAAELKAIEAEREEIMSTPLVTAEAQEVAIEAEIEAANKVVAEEIISDEDSIDDELETPLTKEQIEKLISANMQEREEFYDALDEAQANEEIPQLHIDYLESEIERLVAEYYELWAKLDEINKPKVATVEDVKGSADDNQSDFLKDKIAREVKACDDNNDVSKYLPAVDDFTTKLAKLKAQAAEKQATLIKAQEAHEQATNALETFLNDTALKLKEKLDALPLDYTITLKKIGGSTYHVSDFSEIYIGAYHIGCDVEFRFENWKCRTIARYDTPAQVETVINQLKSAIERGDKEFTFPTIDILEVERYSELLDSLNIPPATEIFAELEDDLNADEGKFTLARYITSTSFRHAEQKNELPLRCYAICSTDFARAEKALNMLKSALAGLPIKYDKEPYIYLASETFDKVESPVPIYYAAELDGSEDDADEEFTVDVMPADEDDTDDELIDLPEPKKADIHDSLARAMKIALLKIQDFCREQNLIAAQNEMKLYNICSAAMRELRKGLIV